MVTSTTVLGDTQSSWQMKCQRDDDVHAAMAGVLAKLATWRGGNGCEEHGRPPRRCGRQRGGTQQPAVGRPPPLPLPALCQVSAAAVRA